MGSASKNQMICSMVQAHQMARVKSAELHGLVEISFVFMPTSGDRMTTMVSSSEEHQTKMKNLRLPLLADMFP